jgi:outer membrane cobalamin receptor
MRYRHPFVSTFVRTAILLVVPAMAYGQAPDSQDAPARFNSEIVVTPERGETPLDRVPAATFVLDRPTMITLPTVFLGETISFMPGFHAARSEFHAARPAVVSARGFFGGGEAEYLLLLIDGVPAGDAESGLIDWSLVPDSAVRRIEAFRGPGASLYGDSAVGGVIQVLTNRSEPHAQLSATGGSFNGFTGGGAFGRRFTTVGIELSGSARGTDGFREHSSTRHLVASGGLDGRLRAASWRWTGSGHRRTADDPGALTLEEARLDPRLSDPLARLDTLERHGFATALTIQSAGTRGGQQGRVYVNNRDEDAVRTIVLAPGFGDSRARAISTFTIGGSGEAQRIIGAGAQGAVVRAGLDVARQNLETGYSPVDDAGAIGATEAEATGRRLRVGAFVSSGWDPVPRLRLTAALRWDRIGDDGFMPAAAETQTHEAWSPRAGAVLRLTDSGAVSLFGQVSNAFKVPTLDQLFDPRPYPDFQGGTFTISNPQLVPQRANNVEGGVTGEVAAVRWSAVAYRMAVDNEIDFDVRTFSYANIAESRHVGAEFEASSRIWNRVQPSFAYTLSRVTRVGGDLQLKNVPRHAVSIAGYAELPQNLAAYLRYRHTAGAFLDDENTLPIEGPSAIDLRVRRLFGNHAVFIDVINLADDRFEEYGFTLTDFQGGVVPYAYPGASRAVRAGASFAF